MGRLPDISHLTHLTIITIIKSTSIWTSVFLGFRLSRDTKRVDQILESSSESRYFFYVLFVIYQLLKIKGDCQVVS